MSISGTPVAQSIAGLPQAEKVEARAKAPEKAGPAQRAVRRDGFDEALVDTETTEAVRALKSNDQEEAQEDRQEHPPYTGKGSLPKGGPRPNLDVKG